MRHAESREHVSFAYALISVRVPLRGRVLVKGCDMRDCDEPDLALVDPALSYCLRAAADFYGLPVSRYVRHVLQSKIDSVSDENPWLREIFTYKP
jgi:hypothetical protein